jgi:type II secretory pathway pseudopilin PulG
MDNSVFNLRNHPGAFSILGKLIASSLILGFLGTIGTTVSAQSSTAQTPRVAQANDVAKRLQGQWQTRPASGGQSIRFVFGPQNKLFIIFPPNSGQQAQALELNYRINPATRPMQLDIISTNNQAAQTIFEFTPDRKLRLQLQGANTGRPRPTSFTPNATIFEKVSETTSLPANMRIVRPQNGNNIIPQR